MTQTKTLPLHFVTSRQDLSNLAHTLRTTTSPHINLTSRRQARKYRRDKEGEEGKEEESSGGLGLATPLLRASGDLVGVKVVLRNN